jgi:hypothetical protein
MLLANCLLSKISKQLTATLKFKRTEIKYHLCHEVTRTNTKSYLENFVFVRVTSWLNLLLISARHH